jgi:integrase
MAMRADDRGLFKRGRRWWFRVYVKGEGKKVIALKPEGQTHATTNRDVARALARDIRRQITEKGRIERAAGTADLPALIEQFQAVNTVEASKTQALDNARHVKDFIGTLGIKHPAEITLERIQEWFVRLHKAKRSPKTIWNHRGSLSRFCEFLIDREHLAANPCRRMKMPRTEKLLPRFLSADEHEQALKLAKEHGIYPEVATALCTGMRREELRRMGWAEVDFERAVVMVPKSKSRRPRAIPMSDKLRAVLLEQQAETGNRKYVFPGRERRDQSGMRRRSWWISALKPLQAALPVFTDNMAETATGRGWHLFRHTFASRLVQAGVPIAKVSAWLGHANIATTMIYAHLAPGHDKDIEKA